MAANIPTLLLSQRRLALKKYYTLVNSELKFAVVTYFARKIYIDDVGITLRMLYI